MGLTQDELAAMLGVEVRLLAGWERDSYPPPKLAVEVLQRLRQPALL